MAITRTKLASDYDISRIIKGGWHLAGDHGPIDQIQAQKDMAAFVEAGITTFDCADIYAGVESLIGTFLSSHPKLRDRVQIHTKFVPDLSDLDRVDRGYVEAITDRSLKRLGVEQIDLVQFHWWDYATPRYVEVAFELEHLRQAGKIAHIGVTNFDVRRLQDLIRAGIPVLTQQLQYSLIDQRPNHGMVEFCQDNGVALLAYGTVAGGFLSDRWLGAVEPETFDSNRSLIKYKLIIDDFGGWALLQRLLSTLRQIADKHGVDIAAIATRAVLDQPQVAAAIVGATSAAHLKSHQRIGALNLDEQDRAAISAVVRDRTGPKGDVYELERDRTGPHGRIMKYELNNQ